MSRLTILMSRISRSFLTLIVFSFVTLSSSFSAYSDSTAVTATAATPVLDGKGEQLFKENCKSCHKIHTDAVGPALAGVTKRRKPEWLYSWVHNSSKMIADGDPTAVELYNKFNKAAMTSFPTLENADIDAILAYVESVPVDVAPVPPVGGDVNAAAQPAGGQYDTIILALIVVVLILVLVAMIVFLSVIKRYLKDKEDKLDAEDKELLNQKFDIKAFVRSKGFIAFVVLAFVVISVRACWMGAQDVAVEQNYAPVQPIAFSHKLHAGDNKINCNYCHTGVYKGKQSNIPSLNICMNCHTYIKSGPKYGETEIKKLTDAYAAGTPIRWVRVHNLPDLAYFNHSQHTQVAGLECQKCHGPIEEMEVVKQYSNLTMGWCINCHRETAVNSKDNAYYDRLLKVHEESKKKNDMTAEEIGGLDCSKCHY